MGSSVHAANYAQAELEVQRSNNEALLPIDANSTQSAEIKDLELRLNALLLVQGAQSGEHVGGVVEYAAGDAPVEGGSIEGAHLNAGNVLVVQHTHSVAVGGVIGNAVVTGGGAVYDNVAVLVSTDGLDGLVELYGIHNASAVVVTHMQMNNRSASLPALISALGDLSGSLGDVITSGSYSAGQSGGNDGLCHGKSILS